MADVLICLKNISHAYEKGRIQALKNILKLLESSTPLCHLFLSLNPVNDFLPEVPPKP